MKRIRISSNGQPGGTQVTDADTGQIIRYVKRVIFEHDAVKCPRITLELLTVEGAEVDVVAEEILASTAPADPEGASIVRSTFKVHPASLGPVDASGVPPPPDNEMLKRGG